MRAVDIFAGCGGMSLGFEQAGIDVVAAFDNWKPAADIYRANFEHPMHEKDLCDEDAVEVIKALKPDVLMGGPPCQDYSIAGKREAGERANLTIRFAEIVCGVKPKWVVFENVYNIERFGTLPVMKAMLSEAGYGLTARILDASRCGVPQARKRFILVGHLGAENGFLDEALEAGLAEKQLTVRDYLGDKLGTQYYYMHPRSYARRGVFSVDEPSATIRGINRPIPENYRRHHGDAAAIEDGVRALTAKERSYLQSFPESFKFEGAKTSVELAIGNAVPPALAKYVATCIVEYEDKLEE
ncbi:DNA cytosine methyltransferase [Gordonibacter pamelaeae]|uniref:DNA cytosine methyltransferase n=1 Tax=Gordonibacter pamelaeae TaxID=471189 RepID=UPI0012B08B42|nr:DNA (cytosine-5-)-methyltransferase [Gordonibacter pamelaeae]MZI83041.1 DNA (cytosine-5-)-methyltransferase [Clostridium butyricum]